MNKRMAAALALALVLPMTAAPVEATHGGSCLHTVTGQFLYDVCFTNTDGETGDKVPVEKLIDLINMASGSDDRIRVALHSLTIEPLAAALKRAKARKVPVRIIIDDKVGSGQDSIKMLTDASGDEEAFVLGDDLRKCGNGCTYKGTSQAELHNKLFLLNIGGGNRTIVTGSMNMTPTSQKQHNDLIFVHSATKDQTMSPYTHYVHYYDRLWAKDWGTWTDSDKSNTHDGSDYIRTNFFGRDQGQPIVDWLNQITKCSGDRNQVLVAASYFGYGDYGQNIRARLHELAKNLNCDVQVVVKNEKQECFLQQNSVGLGDGKVTRASGATLHHKFIATNAEYNGQLRTLVFTGSHNITEGSLRHNDENVIRTGAAGVYSHYDARHQALRQNPPAEPTCP